MLLMRDVAGEWSPVSSDGSFCCVDALSWLVSFMQRHLLCDGSLCSRDLLIVLFCSSLPLQFAVHPSLVVGCLCRVVCCVQCV